VPNWLRLSPVGRQAATGWLHAFDITDSDGPLRYVGTGHGRGAMVVAHDGIWVANRRSKSVVRVDPETLELMAAQTFEKAPIAIAAGPDSIWVLESNGWAWRLWPSGEAEGVARLHRGTVAIEAAGGLVWVLHRGGNLAGVEPSNGEIVTECRLPRPALCMTGGDDGLWIACGGGRRLARVDPLGNVAAVEIELPQRVSCLAPADDRLLAGCRRALARRGSLLAIDCSEPRVVATIALPAAPRAIAVQDSSTAWVACGRGRAREGTIAQIDLLAEAVTERWTTDWPVSDLVLSDKSLLAAMSISVGGYIDDGDAIGFADGG
jgi:hypothetical protein